MLLLTGCALLLALFGAYVLYFLAPRAGVGSAMGLPFKHVQKNQQVWKKSNRFAGACLLSSGFFLVLPTFIWGCGREVQIFIFLVWLLVLLPLLVVATYAYSLLLFSREG